MLLRMYQRWAADRGFQTELLEASPGEEAGLKSATFTVRGENAYGILKAERGVHRLVRQSPFDQAHRRHTSFAQVIVAPLLADDVDVEIDEGDLRIDTYRASGAGGQHVNKTDSRRPDHAPPDRDRRPVPERALADVEQADRACGSCKSRLAELEQEEREAELAKERGAAQDTGFGSQIRSYVLHPYQLVKDHRTDYEIGNAQGCSTASSTGSSTSTCSRRPRARWSSRTAVRLDSASLPQPDRGRRRPPTAWTRCRNRDSPDRHLRQRRSPSPSRGAASAGAPVRRRR